MQNTTIWHRRRVVGTALGSLAASVVLAALLFPIFARPHPRPAPTLDEQRQEAARRVQAIGGWSVLRTQTDALLQAQGEKLEEMDWRSRDLPAPLSYLRSLGLRAYARDRVEPPRIVEIKFFGMHRTGGTDDPYYALWVLPRSASPGSEPKLKDFWNVPVDPARCQMQKVADGVYEVFPRR